MNRVLVLLGLMLASAPANADPPNLLAYEGVLMLDNEQVPNEVRPVTFELYANAVDGVPIYSETQDVTFVNGRFSVLLGNPRPPAPALDPGVFQAPEVYIGVRVGDTALAGRQRIVAAPYAMWTARADNLTVARDLTVGGNARVNGEVAAASARVTGDLSAGAVVLGQRRITGLTLLANATAIATFPATGSTEIRSGGRRLTSADGFCALNAFNTENAQGICSVGLANNNEWVVSSNPSQGTLVCLASCVVWN